MLTHKNIRFGLFETSAPKSHFFSPSTGESQAGKQLFCK